MLIFLPCLESSTDLFLEAFQSGFAYKYELEMAGALRNDEDLGVDRD